MKPNCRKLLTVLSLLFCLTLFPQRADAAPDGTKVMQITATAQGGTATAGVYAVENGYWGYDFELDNERLDLMLKKQTNPIHVSVDVLSPEIIVPDSLVYTKTLKMEEDGFFFRDLSQRLSFQYYRDGDTQSSSVYYEINPHVLNMSVDNLYLTVNSKGFHPGSGAYLPIQANLSLSSFNMAGSVQIKLQILNSKGKRVFSKVYDADKGGYLRFRWDGKASKNNKAGIKAGAYVPNGKYKVEATYKYKPASGEDFAKKLKAVKVTKSFTVSSKTPAGTTGMAQAKELPVYTGDNTIDYLADCMIREAGISASTSADEKVKKIYHYMTTHFKHIHYDSSTKRTVYYDTAKLASKIKKYGKTSLKKYKNQELLYSYDVSYYLEQNMKTRSGVCNDHAAIFALLCRHVGIDAGICTGYYLNLDGSRASHAWNYAVVNGVTWYYDVDVEIQNYGKGQGDYYWYKKTRAQANQTHAFQNIY